MAHSRSSNAGRTNALEWDAWVEWARIHGLSAIPANAYSVALYLSQFAEAGADPSTIDAAKTAISVCHRNAGLCDPTLSQEFNDVAPDAASLSARLRDQDRRGGLVDSGPKSLNDMIVTTDLGRHRPNVPSPETSGTACAPSKFLSNLRPGQRARYETEFGEAWVGDSRKLLRQIDDDSIDLVITSPPYGLVKKKEYGNESQEDYVRWFRPFAKEIHRILKPEGSFILNVAGAWQKGQPTRALYPYRLVLDLCDPSPRRKSPPIFHLAQEFYWFNPAKIPNPVQWANVTRERAKDSVEPIWWFSKSPHPKANNRNVLVPYSRHMQRLLKTGKYNSGPRPSGWNISQVWGKDNGGAIPANFEADDALNLLFNVLVVSNTSSNDALRKLVKQAGGNAHPAMFPTALPEFFVKLLTDEGDSVLDPFAGSNTTGWVADQLRRRWVSIEANREYVENSQFRWTSGQATPRG